MYNCMACGVTSEPRQKQHRLVVQRYRPGTRYTEVHSEIPLCVQCKQMVDMGVPMELIVGRRVTGRFVKTYVEEPKPLPPLSGSVSHNSTHHTIDPVKYDRPVKPKRNTYSVWVLKDTKTGLYYDGIPGNKNKMRCTATTLDAAMEYTDTDLLELCPSGLPRHWQKVRVGEFPLKS